MKVLIIVMFVLIFINQSKGENETNLEDSFFQNIINSLKTSPDDLAEIKSKPYQYNACIWKICSRPLNLKSRKISNNYSKERRPNEFNNNLSEDDYYKQIQKKINNINFALNSHRYMG